MSIEDGEAATVSDLLSVGTSKSLVSHAASDCDFPMYVVPVSLVLRWTRMAAHEVLRGTGGLVLFAQHMFDHVMFVSHTWLSVDHPDPDSVQLGVLQGLCRSFQRAEAPIRVFWPQEFLCGPISIAAADLAKVEYIWLDYACVPQAVSTAAMELRRRAIQSIAKYVLNSRLFVIVAPPATHHEHGDISDYRTWGKRGWCRAEVFAHSVAKRSQVIVAESESNFYLDMGGDRDALMRPPGLGSFSDPSDRELLGPLLSALLDDRIAKEAASGNQLVRRHLLATKGQVLQGMGGLSEPELGFEQWMRHFGFASAADGAGSWTPLRCAVYARRYDVAQQLLEQRADVEAPLREDAAGQGLGLHFKGITILAGLAFMRDDPDGIEWLVRARADPCRKLPRGFPLQMAAIGGKLANIRALLAVRADPRQLNNFGNDAAGGALLGGHAEAARLLFQQHGGLLDNTVVFGWRSCFSAVVCSGSAEALRVVLELRADPNFQNTPSGFGSLVTGAMQTAYYFHHRSPTNAMELLAQLQGMTPLAGACFFGNLAQARTLLQARANASLANCYGRTPLSFAAAKSQPDLLRELLRAAPQCLDTPDCWGLRPLDHAEITHNDGAAAWLIQRGASRRLTHQLACCSEKTGLSAVVCCSEKKGIGRSALVEAVRADTRSVFTEQQQVEA